MGGSITQKSKQFITELYNKNLIDRVETRNIEIKINKNLLYGFDKIVPLIFNFETEWLKFKLKNMKLNEIIKSSIINRINEIDKREKFNE